MIDDIDVDYTAIIPVNGSTSGGASSSGHMWGRRNRAWFLTTSVRGIERGKRPSTLMLSLCRCGILNSFVPLWMIIWLLTAWCDKKTFSRVSRCSALNDSLTCSTNSSGDLLLFFRCSASITRKYPRSSMFVSGDGGTCGLISIFNPFHATASLQIGSSCATPLCAVALSCCSLITLFLSATGNFLLMAGSTFSHIIFV